MEFSKANPTISSDIGSNNNIDMDTRSDSSSEPIEENDFEENDIIDFADLEDHNTDFNEQFFEETNYFIPQNTSDFCKLHPHTECTINDAFLMIFAFANRHGLTWTATEDLARLMNRVIGEEKIPPSKKVLKQKFAPKNCTPVTHFLCDKCDLYLGTLLELNDSELKYCPNCKAQIEFNTKYKKNHFLTIPFQNHMQQILYENSEHLSLNSHSTSDDICDVHDGLYFRNLKANSNNVPYITLTFSTDGAAVFKSTKDKSVWPIQFVINEIDLNHRFKRENIFCAAISFGKTPNMTFYLKPFIEEILTINNNGGLVFKTKNGETKKVLIYPMILTCDILAKQYVLNKSSFHGYNGCSYCMHDGTLVDNRVRYTNKDNVQFRTNEKSREDMIQSQILNQNVNGYKGVSALIALDYFDVVWQPVIDKMHNIDLGIVKKLFSLFLDAENKKKRLVLFSQLIKRKK